MPRITVTISDENLRRLDLLVGLGMIEGHKATQNEVFGTAIEELFLSAYLNLRGRSNRNDMVLMAMESVLPDGVFDN